jgi:hypothetical protein
MSRSFPDFLNAMEWNLVARQSYQANDGVVVRDRLPPRSWLIEGSHVVIIGINSNSARSYWRTGGWATQLIPFLPSTTSQYVAAVPSQRRWLRLRVLTLAVFPKISDVWALELSFPYYFNDVSVEVWRYDGRDFDEFDPLATIESKIDSLQ